jgi:hypothetical protein
MSPRRRYQNQSEQDYAAYLSSIGLYFDYERQWGSKTPDFTITNDKGLRDIIAVCDVKDFRHTPEEEARLRAGEMVSWNRDPSLRTRRAIRDVWPQFEECNDYPCILVLASGGDSLPDHLFVMAAMVGDFTISIPVPNAEGSEEEMAQSFGENGVMIADDGSFRNTRISAVAVMRGIRPDQEYSGYIKQVKDLADLHLADGTDKAATRAYSRACKKLMAELTLKGYDLERTTVEIEYTINPFAAKLFPVSKFSNGFTKIWQYRPEDGRLESVYDWVEQDPIR